MIYDLVLYLLRFVPIYVKRCDHRGVTLLSSQGCYNKEGNIVVLAAYLGQIPKIRQKLQGVVKTIVDERDAELLAQRETEEEEPPTVQEVNLSKHVLIRLVSIFSSA